MPIPHTSPHPVRERRLELLRPKAAVFKTAVAASFTTRANLGVPTGIRTRTLAHGALNAACMPVPASARTWSARRDSNPHRACARCVLSAVRVPVPPRAEIWRMAAELNLRDARLKGALQAAQSPFSCRPQTGGLSRIRTCKLARSSRVTAGSCHPSRLQP